MKTNLSEAIQKAKLKKIARKLQSLARKNPTVKRIVNDLESGQHPDKKDIKSLKADDADDIAMVSAEIIGPDDTIELLGIDVEESVNTFPNNRHLLEQAVRNTCGMVPRSIKKSVHNVLHGLQEGYMEDQCARKIEFINYASEEILDYFDQDGDIGEEFPLDAVNMAHHHIQRAHAYIEGEKRMQGMDEETMVEARSQEGVKIQALQNMYKNMFQDLNNKQPRHVPTDEQELRKKIEQLSGELVRMIKGGKFPKGTLKEAKDPRKKGTATLVDLGPVPSSKKKEAEKHAVHLINLERGTRSSSFSQLSKNRSYMPSVYKKLEELGAEIIRDSNSLHTFFDGDKNITTDILKKRKKDDMQ